MYRNYFKCFSKRTINATYIVFYSKHETKNFNYLYMNNVENKVYLRELERGQSTLGHTDVWTDESNL